MQKVAVKIIFLLSIFLISTIGMMAFVYIKSEQKAVCGTEMPQPICGTENMLTENGLKGRDLFNANCAACHKLYKRMTGPSLKGLVQNERYPSKEYFFVYVRNEQKLVERKDEYALAINKEYSFDYKHYFKLSDLEIQQLLEYIAE
ncbi:c-type cytochrome [Aquimarina litoralis]|uniref:c-type cytochrome n=1 Tax=Aquimarina litoralis TaxID=584605 RepID=UPI001C58965F|nr:cytochrome c [Aquimarina litoralis]MBW1296333.1 c-type cytochrome [Aquimarina litoralis]